MADIAAQAGVSIASVSRALSGSPGVSEATRIRIRGLAAELNYAVSPDAARLAKGSRGRVAVVTADLAHWFYASLLEGIMTALRGSDLDVLLYEVKREEERRRFFDELPARRQVDALIILAFPVSDEERLQLDLMGVTVVMAGGTLGDRPHVRIDDVEAARQATHHLILAGHEHVALINATGRWRLPYAGPQDRFQGYLDALRDADLPVEHELVVEAEWGSSGGADAMARLLSLPRPPTAVVAFSDEMAFGALRTLRRSGIAVPHTVSLVGIDDHEMAEVVELTTVRQPVLELGREAGALVFRLLRGGTVGEPHVTLPTQLVVRGTSGSPRTAG
jgi:LacI family transcriptional regulator, repressor for deo operon, udp, cdd, tsx, nupC, and nupG